MTADTMMDEGRAPTLLSGAGGERPSDTKADVSAELFTPEKQYASALQSGVDTLRTEGWSKEKIAAEEKQMSRFFTEAGVPPAQAGKLHGLFIQYRLRPPSEATVKQWERESRDALNERYGKEADERLAAARELVRSRPDLIDLLSFRGGSRSGLGSHPEIITLLAERAPTMSKGKRR